MRNSILKKRSSIALMLTLLLAVSQLGFHAGSASASYNLALGSYVWASSGAGPSNAVDGVQSTFWQPNYGAAGWITVDLGSVQSVNQIVLKTPTYGHFVEAVTIQTSNSTDDGSFTTQSTSTQAFYTGNGYMVTINLPSAVSTRYVRVNLAPVSGGGTATMLGELEIYGP
ncbi:discoidin domain-containing protein [Cohnella rhizosphaerae]|uniref:Discoidin domain-containing protein n=1 Tax=Cohnella rhizosphaerae TaxID=1457232 RepID=A0A9X4KXW4_9BACL|nr:discoidin domain-containing protein [Cohnella rhizosphaerae]MDG0812763.1 discoidin domain-containing protein [Cohnella rhizosphaerae]